MGFSRHSMGVAFGGKMLCEVLHDGWYGGGGFCGWISLVCLFEFGSMKDLHKERETGLYSWT